MRRAGLKLLPALQKLERLIGHNLNITEEIVNTRVKEAIQNQMKEVGLRLLGLRTQEVDWNRLMLNAAYRIPPFDPGENEKGFRDALIAESFSQLVADSPITPKICRVALVTGDELLRQAVTDRSGNNTNVRILNTPDELKSLINTLVGEVSEQYVARIQERAGNYFFTPKDENSLYYKDSIGKRIREEYSRELESLPRGADRRENDSWTVYPPQFLNKQGQRVSWVSKIIVTSRAFKHSRGSEILSGFTSDKILSGLSYSAPLWTPPPAPASILVRTSDPSFYQSELLPNQEIHLQVPLTGYFTPPQPIFDREPDSRRAC